MTKKSPSNRQASLPGTGPDVRGLLRLKAAAPIKPRKPQAPCDVGLFSDDADQMDLVEMFQDPIEED
jgi:hypothetical protein